MELVSLSEERIQIALSLLVLLYLLYHVGMQPEDPHGGWLFDIGHPDKDNSAVVKSWLQPGETKSIMRGTEHLG